MKVLRKIDPRTTLSSSAIILVAVGSLLGIIGIYKASQPWPDMLWSTGGVVAVLGACLVGTGVYLGVIVIRAHRSDPSRLPLLAAAATVFSGLFLLALAEGSLRILAWDDGLNRGVAGVVFKRTWSEQIRINRMAIANATPSGSWLEPVIIHDAELGWTVGSARASKDGMYQTSMHGLRVETAGEDLSQHRPRYRVALIGDSNAFSLEVPFRDSWGHHLDQVLGDDFQVLNFGVNGYGLDQIYLRYLHDVAGWQPDVVVLGFVQSDMIRSMAVYSFLSFPTWNMPFAKPRLVPAPVDGITRLNPELPTPEAILEVSRVPRLPNVDFDWGYNHSDWQWRFEAAPLLWRYFTAAFPRHAQPSVKTDDAATIALNSRLLNLLFEAISESGAIPVFTYLPPTNDLPETLAAAVLTESSVGYHRMHDCLLQVPAKQRLVSSGHHYSGLANARLAACTAELVCRDVACAGEQSTDPL